MIHPKDLKIEDYTYELPSAYIAQYPLEQRDASKLLVYERGVLKDDVFSHIPQQLKPNSLIVFNQTKVVQVRLLFKKETGAAIEIFCLEPDSRYADIQTAMSQTSSVYWQCLVGGANKWKQDALLSLYDGATGINLEARLEGKKEGSFLIRFDWANNEISFAEVLHALGKVPLPPYMNRELREEDKERYQTIFATEEGSVAAPTAGLHFTNAVFDQLDSKQIQRSYITLHVGAGTFKQVKSARLEEHDMHAEWIDVSIDFLKQLLQHQGHIIAVGTTSMRTLESLYWIGLKCYLDLPVSFSDIAVAQWDPYELPHEVAADLAIHALIERMEREGMECLVTRTQIFIAPGYQPKIVQQLLTNFHQPGSTLLLLVAALIGDDWKGMYQHALAQQYRFLSYGDACLIKFGA